MSILTPDRQQVLAEHFGGELAAPGETRYCALRRCHNGLVDKRPALLACCRGPADVVAAVRFAKEEQLELAIRGGGHSVAGL